MNELEKEFYHKLVESLANMYGAEIQKFKVEDKGGDKTVLIKLKPTTIRSITVNGVLKI